MHPFVSRESAAKVGGACLSNETVVSDEKHSLSVHCMLQQIKLDVFSHRPAYVSVRRDGCCLRDCCGKTGAEAASERRTISEMLSTLSLRWNTIQQLMRVRYRQLSWQPSPPATVRQLLRQTIHASKLLRYVSYEC